MNDVYLCPACSTELPADYPFDHVAIDQALGDRPELFAGMRRLEQREVLCAGLDRGMTAPDLAAHFGQGVSNIRHRLPAGHPESAEGHRARINAAQAEDEATVRRLWEREFADEMIAVSVGRSPNWVGDTRRRLGLATLYKRGRRVAVAA